jgi:hypothetical protein
LRSSFTTITVIAIATIIAVTAIVVATFRLPYYEARVLRFLREGTFLTVLALQLQFLSLQLLLSGMQIDCLYRHLWRQWPNKFGTHTRLHQFPVRQPCL